MGNEVRIKATADTKQATKEVTDLRTAYKTLQAQGSKPLLSGIAAGATVAGLNLVGTAVGDVADYIDDAIHAGSDLNETMSKSSVVFGSAASDVEDFGNSAAKGFGMSKQAAVEAAASFGNVFTGVGIGQQKAADMSETLVKLAGDIASFNNLDPGDALEKLRSGLAGEAEPLRAVGVFLTEAQVKAKAMQMGLVGAHGELSEGSKILARYQLILEQTKTAQGDFARTADGVANTERELNAVMADQEAKIGQKLLPAYHDIQKSQLMVGMAAGAVVDGLDASSHSAQQNAEDFNALTALFGIHLDFMDKVAAGTNDLTAAQLAEKAAMIEAKSAIDDLHPPMTNLSKDIQMGSGHLAAMAGAFRIAQTEADTLTGDISDLSSEIDDELFGKAITSGHLADLRKTHDELEKQRDATKKGSRQWRILTGDIADNEQAQFDLQLQQKQKEGPEAVIDWLKKQKRLFGDATGAIQRLIDKEYALITVNEQLAGSSPYQPGGPKSIAHKHATGGFGAPGELSLVGENGPELRVEGNRGSTYIPLTGNAGGGSWGGGLTINVNGVSVMTPGSAETLARQLEPIITRAQQRRGTLPGARAF